MFTFEHNKHQSSYIDVDNPFNASCCNLLLFEGFSAIPAERPNIKKLKIVG